MDKGVHQKNLKDLKLKQDLNKQRKEEKENSTPGIKLIIIC